MKSKVIYSTSFQTEAILDSVRQKLRQPVDQRALAVLMRKLEEAQKQCDNASLQQQIISLYGRAVEEFNCYVRSKVNKIAEQALDPEHNSSKLKKQVHELRNLHGLSRENFDILAQLDANIQNHRLVPCLTPPESASIEEIEDLFELAGTIFYNLGEERVGMAFARISPPIKTLLTKQLPSLRLTALQERIPTLQALFSVIYHLAGKQRFAPPTWTEIKVFFREKEKLLRKSPSQHRHVILFELPA